MSLSNKGDSNFLSSVEKIFMESSDIIHVPEDIRTKINVANSTYIVRFGVRLRGELHTFTGYRSVHSEHREPVKGGIRYATHCLLYTSPSPRDRG